MQAERAADPALDHDAPLAEVFEDQLRCADLVILNKTDLLDAETLAEVRGGITESVDARGEGGSRRSTRRSIPGFSLALGRRSKTISRRGHPTTTPKTANTTTTISTPLSSPSISIAVPEALEARLEAAIRQHDILRVKGFVDVSGKDMRHVVQCVGSRVDRYYDRPWGADEARQGRLVVIGQKGLDEAAIRRALAG